MGEPTLGASIKLRDLFSEGLKEFREKSEKTQDIVQKGFERLETRIRSVEESLQDARTKGGGFFSSMLAGASKVANIFTAVSTSIIAIGKVFKTIWNIASTVLTGLFRLFTRLGRVAARFTRAVIQDFRELAQGLDAVAKMAVRVGAAVRDLTALRLVVARTGTSMQALAVGLRTGSKNLDDYRQGIGEAVDSFEKLGITQEEANNKIHSGMDLLRLVTERYHLLGDEAEKTAVPLRIFGRAGTDLKPILEGGLEALDKMIAKMKEFGGVFTREELGRVETMNDALGDLGLAWKAIKERTLVDFAPIITGIVGKLEDLFGWVREVAKKIRSALGPAMKDLGEKIQNAITDVTEWARSIEDDLMAALLALPEILSLAGRAISENFEKVFGKVFEGAFRLFYVAGATAIDMFVTGMHAGLKVGGNRIARLWGNIVQDALAAVGLISENKAERRAHIDNILPAVGLDTELFKEAAGRVKEKWKAIYDKLLKDLGDFAKLRVSQQPLELHIPFLPMPVALPIPQVSLNEQVRKAIEEARRKLRDAIHNLGTMTITEKRKEGDDEVDESTTAWAEYWKGIAEGAAKAREQFSAFNRGVQTLGSLVSIAGSTLEGHLFSMAENGFKRMRDAMNAFFADLFRQLGRLAINQALQSLFGSFFSAITPAGGAAQPPAAGLPGSPYAGPPAPTRAEGGVDKGRMGRPHRKVSMDEGGVVGPRDPHIVEFGEGAEEEAFVPLKRHKIPVEVRFSGRRRQQTTTLVDRRTINIDFSGTINAQGDKDVEAAGKNIVQMVKATVHEVLAESGNAHRTIRRVAMGGL